MEELDLKELFNIFWSRKLFIILIIAIFIGIGIAYSYIYISPMYKSETSLLLVKSKEDQNGNNVGTITTNDLTLNQKLVATYSELIKSQTIINTVKSNLNIDKTEEQLRANIKVSAVENTELIKITVTDENPQIAKTIADETAQVFAQKIAIDRYKIDNVQIMSEAQIETTPYNINHIKDIIIFAFIGIVVSVIYVLIANLLDTTIKGKEDIEKKIGITVLATIPTCNFNNTNTKKGKKQ